MIVDSSAIVAILLEEPEAERLILALASAQGIGVGAPTLVETAMVLASRLGFERQTALQLRFLQVFRVQVVPFGDGHWQEARDAFARFGRGRHPAGLNFGDCLTYAVARLAGQPLLCVGGDFPQTDLPLAPY